MKIGDSNIGLRDAAGCGRKAQPVRKARRTPKNRPLDKAAGCPFYLALSRSLALPPLRSRTKARETSPTSARARKPSSRCSWRRMRDEKVGGLHGGSCFGIAGRADRTRFLGKNFVVGMRREERMQRGSFGARNVAEGAPDELFAWRILCECGEENRAAGAGMDAGIGEAVRPSKPSFRAKRAR